VVDGSGGGRRSDAGITRRARAGGCRAEGWWRMSHEAVLKPSDIPQRGRKANSCSDCVAVFTSLACRGLVVVGEQEVGIIGGEGRPTTRLIVARNKYLTFTLFSRERI
jgi:hypothetical protein